MNIGDRLLCREVFEDKYIEKHKEELTKAIQTSALTKYVARQEQVYYRYSRLWDYRSFTKL